MRAVALLILFIIMAVGHIVRLGNVYDDPMARTMVGFGFLVFTGITAGVFASRLRLPKITGYLFAGMLCGPYVLGLIDFDVVERLKTIDDLALALIAFTAGGELRVERLKRAGKAIASITFFQTIAAFALTAGAILLAHFIIKPFPEQSFRMSIAIALFCGLVAVANSPATAIAVIVDLKARGKLTEQILSVTVLKDIVVIILAAVIVSLSGWILKPHDPFRYALIGTVLLKTTASLVAGGITAALIIAYLRYIRKEMVLFVVVLSLLIVYESDQLHIHFPLQCMAAGFFVEHFSRFGDHLIRAIERTSMTVYIIFFSIAGASIDFGSALTIWAMAMVFIIVRTLSIAAGTAVGAALAGEPVFMKRYAWSGYLGQAGISLGIASMILRTFPEAGAYVYPMIVTAVAVNQIAGPIALHTLLNYAGETETARIDAMHTRYDYKEDES